MKFFKCIKCENISIGPDTEGVELKCGAFTNFELLEAQDALDHGVRPSWDKALKLGEIRMTSVSSCGGELEEITEEESIEVVSKMSSEIQFRGVREVK